jgi:hypothetical protein
MIERRAETLDGRRVIRLIPENEADLRELRRIAEEKQIDDDDSFADKLSQDDQKPTKDTP